MKKGNLSKPIFMPLRSSGLKLSVTVIIVLMVISSPVFMLVNPTQVSAATISNNSNRIDSSGYHSTPSIPAAAATSPLSSPTPMVPAAANQGKDGDFTTQATLSLTRATQTNNIVNSKAYYDVMFRTSTPGVIKTIEMDLAVGTYTGAALLVEATGIGPGKISSPSSSRVIYTVTNAVNVPANTNIRIQLANINNPQNPTTEVGIITTRDPANNIIDTATTSNTINIKKINTNDIANDAITPFVIQRLIQVGLNPGATSSFSAPCANGEQVVGGGYKVGSGIEVLGEEKDPSQNAWRVTLRNPSGFTIVGQFIMAECMPSLP